MKKNCVLLVLQDFGCLGGEAIDVPVCLTMPVTNGDGEPAEVCPDHSDGAVQPGAVTGLARHRHVLAFAPVVSLVKGAVGTTTCNQRWRKML